MVASAVLPTDSIEGLRKSVNKKRAFDLGLTLISAPLWLPVAVVCGLAILLREGRPALYRSSRRVYQDNSLEIVKFRTMVRNADKVANRETIPAVDTCFLNIPLDSALYTGVGRVIEALSLTEIPQFIHVIAGEMSIVGSRPLPRNVVAALCERYPYAEDRFLSKSGLTGPVQLIGRENISDLDRLTIEIDYALLCTFAYSMRLDLVLLLNTVFVAAGLVKPFTPHTLRILMSRYTGGQVRRAKLQGERRSYLRYPVKLPIHIQLADGGLLPAVVKDISYRGAVIALQPGAVKAIGAAESLDLKVQLPAFLGSRLLGLKCRIVNGAPATDENLVRLEFSPDRGHGTQIAAIIASGKKSLG